MTFFTLIIRHVQDNQRGFGGYLIALSADVLPEQVARMRAAGMNDSLEKPINVEALDACLRRHVGRGDGDLIAVT